MQDYVAFSARPAVFGSCAFRLSLAQAGEALGSDEKVDSAPIPIMASEVRAKSEVVSFANSHHTYCDYEVLS